MDNLITDSQRYSLRPAQVERLLDVVRDLAREQPAGQPGETTIPAQKAARMFATALEENPYLVLRNLIFALEEVGHRAAGGGENE
ncbi:hypothetical protein BSZ35_02430 [Salinibacter sp. 10B]|uniref:hypothetical protein n=1 Tax=Salinibacter sp. 10B TaxID=1923971 RepID=UPI000D2D97BE|nr:hypothetical protein [Salinibacter sp. 10B]PQJ33606.1 hypothetical protein BSZ35_02430 [Salinibacter sp. 10B]